MIFIKSGYNNQEMRNHYKFEEQIKNMQQIFQTNIKMAEIANALLDRIPHVLVEKVALKLKYQYQERYLKEDEEKYEQIRMALNIINKDKVCNIDELFINLGTQINSYYDHEYLKLSKMAPYKKQCRFCKQMKSNTANGLRQHQFRCKLNPENKDVAQAEKKIKIVDTKQSYQKRQIRIKQKTNSKFIQSDEQRKIQPKKKKIQKGKKNDKQPTLILYCKKQKYLREKEIYDGLVDFKRLNEDKVYHSDDDQLQMKNVANRHEFQAFSTVNPTIRDFQLLEDEPQQERKRQDDNYNEFLQ